MKLLSWWQDRIVSEREELYGIGKEGKPLGLFE